MHGIVVAYSKRVHFKLAMTMGEMIACAQWSVNVMVRSEYKD